MMEGQTGASTRMTGASPVTTILRVALLIQVALVRGEATLLHV